MMASDMLRKLASNSQMALDDGIYDVDASLHDLQKSDHDLTSEIKDAAHAAVISEIKFASPSEGTLRTHSDPAGIAVQMVKGGAKGLSVLTQPHLFGGSPEYFIKVRQAVNVPMLMKDVIIDKRQIDAAYHMGADYILLIQSIFQAGAVASGLNHNGSSDYHTRNTLDDFIKYAHEKNLGVLLEVHTIQEYADALRTDADVIGINNRNLDTLAIDINVTKNILSEYLKMHHAISDGRAVVSESGILSPADVRTLHSCGVDGFLIGSGIMKSSNIQEAVHAMVNSY